MSLCKKCHNERRLKQGEEAGAASKWRALVEQKGFRRKIWAGFGFEQFLRRMWERFTIKTAWASSVLADAANVRQNGTDGRWQHETPHTEDLELLRHCTDLRFEGVPMRQAYYYKKSGDWANCLENVLRKAQRMDKFEGGRMLQ